MKFTPTNRKNSEIESIPEINYWQIKTVETEGGSKPSQPGGINGGMMKQRTAVPDMGWFAMMIDPQGNRFAMGQSDPGAK